MPGVRVAVTGLVGFWCAFAAGDVTVRGRVVDKSGRPVAEAQVFCLKPLRINGSIESVDGKTGADGTFAVTLAGVEKPADLKNESVLIYAEGHGLGVTAAGELLAAAADATPVTVSLPAETEKTFRVLDPGGRPVTGALVEPVNYLYGPPTSTHYGVGMKVPETLMSVLARTTDELGVAKFPALAPDKLRTMQIISDEYGRQEIGWTAKIEAIRLRATARVKVVFNTTKGKLRPCQVVAFTSDFGGSVPFGPGEAPKERPTTGVHYAAIDEASGGFEIPGIAAGVLQFRLSHGSNDQPVLPVWPVSVMLQAGMPQTIEVPLEKTVTIRGRVVDREANPCENVSVAVGTPSGRNVIITSTDVEGRYRCNVLKGEVIVTATRGAPDQWFGGGGRSSIRKDVESDVELPDYVLAPDESRNARPSR
jgi:hypothetical protein